MLNNVLGTLKYDITAGALSLVIQPISATAFLLPPSGTDAAAGTPTYGKKIETIILTDRPDLSQAKYEIVQCTLAVVETAGANTYTVNTGGRGAEGTTAQAWVAANTVYAFQLTTAGMLDLLANGWAMRAQFALTTLEPCIVGWDGTTFKFGSLRAIGVGRGYNASINGYLDITMPANGSVASGWAGAASATVAAGGFPLIANTSLYYEPAKGESIGTSVAGSFRIVGYTAGLFDVPPHWILIGSYVGGTGIKTGTGAMLGTPHLVGGGGEPTFQNSWINYGGSEQSARFIKSSDGRISLDGLVKSGAVTYGTIMFTLPAGFRPAGNQIFAAAAAGTHGEISIDPSGNVKFLVGSATYMSLAGISFLAAA